MHDNGRLHVTGEDTDYLNVVGVSAVKRPPRESDPNPIAHAWHTLKQGITRKFSSDE